MLAFKEFILESTGGGLHVFDIDDTLFKTTAKIRVKHKKTGEVLDTLTNSQFNTHRIHPDHEYDFSEFRSAQKFDDESEPMHNMIGKLKSIHKNVKSKANSRIILNTARADFDDKDRFLNAFRKRGVDIDNIHVHRTGNDTSNKSIAEKKNDVVRKHLATGNYRHVTLYDDSKENLNHFLGLKKEHPDVDFRAYHVQHDGTIRRHR